MGSQFRPISKLNPTPFIYINWESHCWAASLNQPINSSVLDVFICQTFLLVNGQVKCYFSLESSKFGLVKFLCLTAFLGPLAFYLVWDQHMLRHNTQQRCQDPTQVLGPNPEFQYFIQSCVRSMAQISGHSDGGRCAILKIPALRSIK